MVLRFAMGTVNESLLQAGRKVLLHGHYVGLLLRNESLALLTSLLGNIFNQFTGSISSFASRTDYIEGIRTADSVFGECAISTVGTVFPRHLSTPRRKVGSNSIMNSRSRDGQGTGCAM